MFEYAAKIDRVVVLLLLLILCNTAHSKSEKEYQTEWCTDGFIEYRLDDNTRIDCLTKDYAVEHDFARKYHEAIGQSLHYALKTGKRPGIVLIMKSQSDIKYWDRMQQIILKYNLPIQTWQMW